MSQIPSLRGNTPTFQFAQPDVPDERPLQKASKLYTTIYGFVGDDSGNGAPADEETAPESTAPLTWELDPKLDLKRGKTMAKADGDDWWNIGSSANDLLLHGVGG